MQFVADTGSAALALTAATAKTILMLKSTADLTAQLIEWGVSFDGTNAANTPVLVELVKSTNATNSTPGTNNTTVTPVQVRGNRNDGGAGGAASGVTAFANSTSEPTVLTVVKRLLVPPTSGLIVQCPLGREEELPALASPFTGLGIRCNAPQAVNVRAYAEYVIGPS